MKYQKRERCVPEEAKLGGKLKMFASNATDNCQITYKQVKLLIQPLGSTVKDKHFGQYASPSDRAFEASVFLDSLTSHQVRIGGSEHNEKAKQMCSGFKCLTYLTGLSSQQEGNMQLNKKAGPAQNMQIGFGF